MKMKEEIMLTETDDWGLGTFDGLSKKACSSGTARFVKAHPDGLGDVYSVWMNELHAGLFGDTDANWYAIASESRTVFNAIIARPYSFLTYVNCHITTQPLWWANGRFIGCTFADGTRVHPEAEVIE